MSEITKPKIREKMRRSIQEEYPPLWGRERKKQVKEKSCPELEEEFRDWNIIEAKEINVSKWMFPRYRGGGVLRSIKFNN